MATAVVSSEVERVSLFSLRHSVLVACAFALLAYPQLFILPALPIVPAGDELLWLVDGERINHGQVIYRDFYEITFPGAQYFYAAVQHLFGPRAWIPVATYILLGALTAALIFSISRRILPGRLPWLAVGLYLVGPFFAVPDATHHWFAAVFAYAAVWLLLRSTASRQLAIAAACCAASAYFMQAKGALSFLGITAFVLWRDIRIAIPWKRICKRLLILLGSFSGLLTLLLAPAVVSAGIGRFFYNTVGFLATTWGSEFFGTWRIYMAFPPAHSSWLDIPAIAAFLLVYGAVPLVYILVGVRYLRDRRAQPDEPWDAIALIWLAGVALFLAVAKAPSTIRLASGSAPAMVLLVWLLRAPARFERLLLRAAPTLVALLAVACPLTRQLQRHTALDTRIGRVAFYSPPWHDAMADLLPLLPPGQPCFGNHAACYLAGDVVVGPVNYILPSDYTTAEQVDQLVRDLDRHRVPHLVLRAIFYLPFKTGAHEHLRPFRDYLYSHYRIQRMLPNSDELWVRLPDAVSAETAPLSHTDTHNFSSLAHHLRN